MVQVYAQKIQGIPRAPLEATVTPVLRAHGVDSAELSYQMERGGWVLRVTVESLDEGASAPAEAPELPVVAGKDGGIHLGLLTEIARDLSSVLDVADVIPHRYSLEVSSAGLERPLRTSRDYQRAKGQLAKVHLAQPAADGQRVLRGRIEDADGDAIRIEVDGKLVTARLEDIEQGHLISSFKRSPGRLAGGVRSPANKRDTERQNCHGNTSRRVWHRNESRVYSRAGRQGEGDRQEGPRRDHRSGDPEGRAERLRAERASSRRASTKTPARSTSSST